MKTKLFKSTISLLLALLLCFSLVTPAIYADDNDDQQPDEPTRDITVLEKHADSLKVTRNDLISLFGDSSSSSIYYGIASPDDAENITNVTSSSSANVTAGEYIAYRTTAYTGGILSRKADWTKLDKRSSKDIEIKVYYNGTFTVNGSSDGALYLNGEAVSGSVRLYADETYTVTADEVEGFNCEVTGVTLGEEFTPDADVTVVANYVADAAASISVTANEGGTVKVMSGDMEITDIIPAGESFEVIATPNTNRGYVLESIVVTLNGEEVEPVEGLYGPVADEEEYEITVTFSFDPPRVQKEADANNARVTLDEMPNYLGSYSYYGVAPIDDPDNITQLVNLLNPNYSVSAGEYYIYATNDSTGSIIKTPVWTNAKIMILEVRTYYNATFTVTGNDEGEIYLNGEPAADGKLYTDEEYTVTAKEIDDYVYTMTGAEDGVAFTPTANVNVTVAYMQEASATFTLTANEGGTAEVQVNGETATDRIAVGDSFTVVATPNSNKGYKLESIVVTLNGEEVEAVEGAYGPVADGEEYAVTVTFVYDPPKVTLDVDADEGDVSRSDLNSLFGGDYNYYGIAPKDDPDNISYLAVALTSDYDVVDGGVYCIYGSNDGNLLSPKWTNAKLMEMTVRTYYNGTFTVSGNDEGEVYLNDEAVTGNVRLYTDSEYTVTVKEIEEYNYTLDGAEEGVAFAPTSDVNVTLTYLKIAFATFTLTANEGGTAEVQVNGEAVTERISEGESFTVVATPNSNRGYKLESIVVTKDGEEVEAVEGAYGPVADGEEYEITVTFEYDPPTVTLEVDANEGDVSRSDLNGLFGGAYNYYGIAPKDDPDNISYLAVALTSDYDVVDGGVYCIYGSNDGNLLSPKWTNAKLMEMTVRTYYNGTFTVTGHEEGEVYLDGEAVTGNVKLYTDSEYTVTAKEIEEYNYTMTGAEDGVTFAPTSDVNVTVTYLKIAFATFTLTANDGGTAEVQVNSEAVTERISEGESFTVVTAANENKGYKLESVVVTKDGEEVEAVEGAYGPVADGEEYEITVTFEYDPPTVTLEVDANEGDVSRSDLNGLFGGAYNYYGIAPKDDPENISYLAVALTSDYDVVEGGVYCIYGSNDGNLLSPKWTNAKLMEMTVRTYYNGTFTVTGHEEGEVYLDGEAVTGNVKLYVDSEYTVTTKEIEEYICTLYGAEEGVAFTPTEAVEITAVYIKEAYATISVAFNEGGTVEVLSDGETVFDKLEEGKSFVVNATADADNDYYVESIVVTKDGEEVEAVEGAYGPVLDDEEYVITVTFAKAEFSAEDCEVSYVDIKNKAYDAIAESIIANTALTPEEFAGAAEYTVKYAAYSLLGTDIYEPLDFSGMLSHAFGTSTLNGELADGNTEKVRVTCELPELGIKMTDYITVTVKDMRLPTTVEGQELTITYGDDLKAAVLNVITVYNEEGEEVEFTASDISVNPTSLNATLFSRENVTVTFGGNDEYASSQGTVSVYVKQAPSSIDAKSETITYGETPSAEIRTTPENLDYLRVIAGVDGDAQGFVSIDIPESVKNKMRIKVGDLVLFDMYEFLSNQIGDGATPQQFREIIASIFERVNGNETIRAALEASGFDMDTLELIMNFINELPSFDTNMNIRLGQVPSNAGVYLIFAISTDLNYKLSWDVSYLIIKRQGSSDENDIELRFKNSIEGKLNILSYEEAKDFEFGGDAYINDELYETDHVYAIYVGADLDGNIVIDADPIRDPGVYTEVVYMHGGNYMAVPIIRAYTVTLNNIELQMNDMTVEYDGAPHALTATDTDGVDITEGLTYVYYNGSKYSYNAPINAGEYTVYAIFDGDDINSDASISATLIITPKPIIVTIDSMSKYEGTDDPEFTFTAADINGDPIDAEELGITISREEGEEPGDYELFVSEMTNTNYVIDETATTNGTLTIEPKIYYMIGDVDGDGEVSSADATLIMRMIADFPVPDDLDLLAADVDGDGEISVADATFIQRYLAEMGNKFNVGELAERPVMDTPH